MEIAQIEGNAMIQTLMRQREEGFNQVAKLTGTVAGLQAQLAAEKATLAEAKDDLEDVTSKYEKTKGAYDRLVKKTKK